MRWDDLADVVTMARADARSSTGPRDKRWSCSESHACPSRRGRDATGLAGWVGVPDPLPCRPGPGTGQPWWGPAVSPAAARYRAPVPTDPLGPERRFAGRPWTVRRRAGISPNAGKISVAAGGAPAPWRGSGW